MKFLFTTFLTLSFVGVAVFGTLGMGHQWMEQGGKCIASIVQGVECPNEQNPLTYAAFYLGALKSFSLAVFDTTALSALLAFLALLFSAGFRALFYKIFKPPQVVSALYRLKRTFSFPQEQSLVSWLAIHENSPAFF